MQPGVTGIENVEFGVPRLAANGAAMRINYQIDGNTNTEKDRAGLRLLPMSEVMIQEVKVVTTGFAPEFGQTMGMVFNAVTPSGTNAFHGRGQLSVPPQGVQRLPVLLRLRQHDVGGQLPGRCRRTRRKPETKVDTGTASVGGPIVKNKLFFYGGWEQTRRDLSSGSPDHRVPPRPSRSSACKPQPAAAPNVQTAKFMIAKGDYQISSAQSRQRRAGFSSTTTRRTTAAAASTRSSAPPTSSTRWTRSPASWSRRSASNKLNELRVQYAHRHQSSVANSDSGTGPAVTDHRRRRLRRPGRAAPARATPASTSSRTSRR